MFNTDFVVLCRIMLVLDKAPIHPPSEELDAIDKNCKIVYLPSDVTSLLQPMHQGIISTVKHNYRTNFIREVLSQQFTDNAEVVKFLKKWTSTDSMHILKYSWDSVLQSTLCNSWKKLIPSFVTNTVEIIPDINELVVLLNRIPGGGVVSYTDVSQWLENEPEEHSEGEHSDPEETDDVEDIQEESLKPKVFLNAAKLVIEFSREYMNLSGEEMSTLVKIRDHALDYLTSTSNDIGRKF